MKKIKQLEAMKGSFKMREMSVMDKKPRVEFVPEDGEEAVSIPTIEFEPEDDEDTYVEPSSPGKLKFAVVNSSDLGNCWSPSRFCGGRCARVVDCRLPERNTCKAVDVEKKYLNQFYLESHKKLNELQKSSLGKLRRRNG